MRGGARALVAVIAACVGLAGAASGATGGEAPPAEPWEDPEVRRGGAVFQATCAACHGTRAEGGRAPGRTGGPALTELPLPYVDLVLRTGRMPIAAPEVGVLTEELDDDDRAALVAWMRARFDLPGDLPDPGAGDAAAGLGPFVRHCAACHGAGGGGGVAGGGTVVPRVRGLDPVTIVEATRVGPFEMPAFSEEIIDDETLEDIAAYLVAADDAPWTFLGLREVDQVGAAVAGAVLLLAAVGLLRAVSRPRPERET